MSSSEFSIVLFSVLCLLSGWVGAEVTQSEDGSSGSISFKPPDLNDEEHHSDFMPMELRCDACTAIAYLVRYQYFCERLQVASPSYWKWLESIIV